MTNTDAMQGIALDRAMDLADRLKDSWGVLVVPAGATQAMLWMRAGTRDWAELTFTGPNMTKIQMYTTNPHEVLVVMKHLERHYWNGDD